MENRLDLELGSATINEITARYPKTIAVFNDFGVDACCGGDATLREAAERDSVDCDSLTASLRSVIAGDGVTARA